MERYALFKRFDTVSDHSDHYFSAYTWTHRPKDWEEKLRKEWKDIEEQLPENMLVRAYERRIDLLRAVIIGPKGTPYHDGLFFFDVRVPSTYPTNPPVHYYSNGLSIHGNVHTSGSVRLYQPIRDDGPQRNEKIWVPGTSTMLHFLGFLKNLFCEEPLLNGLVYNNPDWFDGVPSLFYNELAFIKSVKTMVTIMNKPPINFEDFVVGHFRNVADDTMKACQAYMDGVQVGCLVDGVPKEGNKGIISKTFKNDLASSLKPLVDAFERIGAKVVADLNPPS
ncbi:putative ubiquitin-conjugating enzyme E2, ubiquitin-conjugating enzyme/RWD [Helianthus debilis subsp. tardiflorus]